MDTSRQLKCTTCGASVAVRPGDDIAFCEYCGSYSNPDGTVYRPDHDERTAALRQKMGKTIAKGNLEAWRPLCYEYCLVETRLHPEQHPNCPAEGPALQGYINGQVKLYELLAFDAGVKAAFAHCQDVINELAAMSSGHVAAARRLLDAYRRYFNTYLHHPEYPYPVKPGEAGQQALDVARSACAQYRPLWGDEALARINVDVFGDKHLSSGQVYCDSCGMLLDPGTADQVACGACGSVTYLGK